jgi:hypothetical protein
VDGADEKFHENEHPSIFHAQNGQGVCEKVVYPGAAAWLFTWSLSKGEPEKIKE